MHPETLVEALEREPFIPFRLNLSDGRTLDILNPGLCFIAHLALYVFKVRRGRRTLADEVEVISLLQIVSVKTLEEAA